MSMRVHESDRVSLYIEFPRCYNSKLIRTGISLSCKGGYVLYGSARKSVSGGVADDAAYFCGIYMFGDGIWNPDEEQRLFLLVSGVDEPDNLCGVYGVRNGESVNGSV